MYIYTSINPLYFNFNLMTLLLWWTLPPLSVYLYLNKSAVFQFQFNDLATVMDHSSFEFGFPFASGGPLIILSCTYLVVLVGIALWILDPASQLSVYRFLSLLVSCEELSVLLGGWALFFFVPGCLSGKKRVLSFRICGREVSVFSSSAQRCGQVG